MSEVSVITVERPTPIVIAIRAMGPPGAGGGGGGVSDHGALTGLGDDDHSQYHTDGRGDARYWPLSTDLATQTELNAHTGDTADAHAASAITNTPAGTVAATTVQAAIDELGSEKVAKAGDTMTGDLVVSDPATVKVVDATDSWVLLEGNGHITSIETLGGASTVITPGVVTASGSLIGNNFAPASTTGATVAARYFRGTATSAPASGTWAVGDMVPSVNGKLWMCTVAGTPGTWAEIGGAGGVTSVDGNTGAVVLSSSYAPVAVGALAKLALVNQGVF